MRGLAKYLSVLALSAGLAGCYGGGYGYSDAGYYGDYSYAPSYGVGFTYYGCDYYGRGYHHWAPNNDWHWHNNNSGSHWHWYNAGNGWQGGGRH